MFLYKGPIFLKHTKILSQHHHFQYFLFSLSLSFKNTFMDKYDRIYNCNGLKYGTYEIFATFNSLILMGIKI
jgi:hypothetical protein